MNFRTKLFFGIFGFFLKKSVLIEIFVNKNAIKIKFLDVWRGKTLT